MTKLQKRMEPLWDHAFKLWNEGMRDKKEIAKISGLSYGAITHGFTKAGL